MISTLFYCWLALSVWLPQATAFVAAFGAAVRPTVAAPRAASFAMVERPTPTGSRRALLAGATSLVSTLTWPQFVAALVKGNAPPPKGQRQAAPPLGSAPRSMEEAREEGERREMERLRVYEEDAIRDGQAATFLRTLNGVRYLDIVEGTGAEVRPGSTIDLRYRVLKLGKRAYDGISGEGTLLFSLGYGEDDDVPGATLALPVGGGRLVSAVDEAVIGMRAGGKRRVLVRPDRGWLKPGNCASTIDIGAMAGLPGASVSKVEDCIDYSLEPRPVSFGAQRRMARRFDEALIVECEIVGVR
ncbi:unnamed protein product [Phaeothamnion confervicola]